MTDTAVRGGAERTLTARTPACAVIQKCLSVQDDAPRLGRVARFFGVTPLSADARSWYQGALGEIEVARALTKLGPEFTVLHSVPVGSGESDIDHVVIGPTGVFTLNAKNHSGKRIFVAAKTFTVNGARQPYLRNSEHEAVRASTLLSAALGAPVHVAPVIVVVGAESISVGRAVPVVAVRSSARIGRWLSNRRQVLTGEAVAAIVRAASQPATWHAAPVILDDTRKYLLRFERLRKQVDAATRRARLWIACATLGGLFALATVSLDLLRALSTVAR